jgi:predicted CXXCH cytochrome family protein
MIINIEKCGQRQSVGKGASARRFCLIGMALSVFIFAVVSRGNAAGPGRFMPNPSAGAEYVGTETCLMCHEDEHREFQLSAHARIIVETDDGAVVQGCESCHGPGSLHVDADGGRGTMVNPGKNPETCFNCHLDKKAEFRLPYRHPVLEGKMSCSDCHNPHGPDARPWTSTSLDGVNEACFNCHKEHRGPFVFEHEALQEGCTSCHKVHGSIHDKMLVVRDINLCLRCHTQTNFPRVGDRNHSTDFSRGTCFSAGCHTAMHGSNFDDHLRY